MNVENNQALDNLYDYAIDLLASPEKFHSQAVQETIEQVARSILNYDPEELSDLPFSIRVAVIDRSLEHKQVDQIQHFLKSDICSAIMNQDHHMDSLAEYFIEVIDDGRSARIRDNRLDDAHLQTVINKINNAVESLILDNCKIFKKLPDFQNLNNLKSIIIRSALNLSDISTLNTAENLEYLEIHNAMDIESFEALKDNKELKTLIADRCGVSSIETLTSLEKLSHLELSKCFHLTDYVHGDKPLLKSLIELKNLEVLNLSHIFGLKNATPLATLSRLKQLDISNTGIQDLTPLSELENLESLTVDAKQEVPELSDRVEIRTVDRD
ncbi:MAG: hypothetical protein WD595_06550 [Waddliaceae bacterium]